MMSQDYIIHRRVKKEFTPNLLRVFGYFSSFTLSVVVDDHNDSAVSDTFFL